MGGGRNSMEDLLDLSVGFVISTAVGDVVSAGEPLATIFARDAAGIRQGETALAQAIVIGEEADRPLPLISHRVTSRGVEHYEG